MKSHGDLPSRVIVIAVVSALLCPLLAAQETPAAPEPQQPASSQQQEPPAAEQPEANPEEVSPDAQPQDRQTEQQQLPDSPGSMSTPSQAEQKPVPAVPAPQVTPREPVGTAVAEPITTTGVAASKPAGVAIAPAKQRNVRSLLIKMGLIVGAGAAIGVTYGLSKGSPSTPPGAR